MISSLRSIFSPPQPRVLLLGGERAILYLFDGDRLARAYIFRADDGGLAVFDRCLAELPAAPLAILVDIVEEEYRQDTIPHVGAADRRAMLARKYARLFRGTPYHHALRQGRETEGRRDDRVLLTALTRPEILAPWLATLLARKVPIAGIYSLPVLSERVLTRIGASGANVLLISLHKASGLRQTFFRDGLLKISRLAHMPRLGSVPFAAHLVGEVEKLRRYLNSLALISRDSPLSVYILSHGQLLDELEQHCHDSENEKFFLLDVAEVAARIGLEGADDTHFSDAVFARLLAARLPPNHYAQAEETQFHTLLQLRRGLASASLALVLGAAVWSATNFIDGVTFRQQALDAAQKASFYHERYELARAKLPATPVEPREIKVAVDAVAELRARKTDVPRLLARVGAACAAVPAVALDEFEFHNNNLASAGGDGATAAAGAPAEVAEVRAHIARFDGDYARAIDVVDEFAATLAAQPGVATVEVLRYPLDVRPESSISGINVTRDDAGDARFNLRVVMEGRDGREAG